MERFLILLALAGLSYLLLYTEGLVKNSRTRFAVLGVLLAAFGVRFFLFGIAPNDTASASIPAHQRHSPRMAQEAASAMNAHQRLSPAAEQTP